MSVLIRDILNYSRLTGKATRFVPVDLNEILQQIKEDFELVIEQKGAQIFFDTLPSINGDPSQLNQLFSNLIGNALKFTTTKPVITILWRYLNKEDKRKNIRLDPSLDYMEILVKDNGIGFDQQYADRIFTIFQRLTTSELYRGTGIGLALCKRIVENHRGYIWASGEEGKGASFYVVLPLQLF
jgi:signal transduction histidine kinase